MQCLHCGNLFEVSLHLDRCIRVSAERTPASEDRQLKIEQLRFLRDQILEERAVREISETVAALRKEQPAHESDAETVELMNALDDFEIKRITNLRLLNSLIDATLSAHNFKLDRLLDVSDRNARLFMADFSHKIRQKIEAHFRGPLRLKLLRPLLEYEMKLLTQ